MSSGLSNLAIESMLNHMFATGTYSKPAGHKLHLHVADPHASGAEVDVVVDDTAYAEQTITFDDEGDTADKRVYNDALITFPAVVYGTGAAAYDVTHWSVQDGSGVLMAAGPLPTTVTRNAGEPMALNIGAIYIELERTA
ncbi:MAG: hypothetical protein DRQ97_09945 [Gammaproteobacteria bacterium]|nr:MAG: hypothetical protein DRQ97_09945 [Gammaproteobacteria bacterium]